MKGLYTTAKGRCRRRQLGKDAEENEEMEVENEEMEVEDEGKRGKE